RKAHPAIRGGGGGRRGVGIPPCVGGGRIQGLSVLHRTSQRARASRDPPPFHERRHVFLSRVRGEASDRDRGLGAGLSGALEHLRPPAVVGRVRQQHGAV